MSSSPTTRTRAPSLPDRESLGAVRDDPATAGFRVHYQPITDAISGEVTRIEALLRWSHPTLGEISPAEFIPLAERNKKVESLDRFVLHQGCRDLAMFLQVNPGLHLQVNLSPVGLTAERITDITNGSPPTALLPNNSRSKCRKRGRGFDALIPSSKHSEPSALDSPAMTTVSASRISPDSPDSLSHR
ncbi:MAG: EAL domain-containing protein [Acidimicrobiales bacterium]